MPETLKLFLPVLIPSWRFFDAVHPSPRIEFALFQADQDVPVHWEEFRPGPVRLSVTDMIRSLFWNPRRNESLFLVSCAERIMDGPAENGCQEIIKRIGNDLRAKGVNPALTPFLRFRLVFISRQGAALQRDIAFMSPAHALERGAR